ncbi:TIGR03986 family CRISPR-associated RAMP protein [bacterium]|nr:TIGR03986 family CRISPR-associated RAMP protein [bacterium]MBU1956918.1 TIGR03986 family CRISPR-associated RAMP protein [bacterium]
MITAPFNFVPLSEKVFFPDWAEQVSHDIPFEDSQSGVINITITAKSPIFIRNHSSDKNNPSTEFCNYNGEYYIPSSSVKGMVRNVLEIMSFSKMRQFDNDTYAVRDLSSAKNFYMTQMNLIDEPFTQCGWLKKDGECYIIEDCGIPGRIHHNEIDRALGVDFASKFHREGFEKTSEYKYNLVDGNIHTISVGDMYRSAKNLKYDKREFFKFNSSGRKRASLVLTGQPTPRKNTGKMGDGKGFEFLFFDVKSKLEVDKKVFENFKFAYFDGRDTEPKESPDWKYWKEKLYSGEKVPVFFQKSGKNILHFGLSYLYKLPYKHSVKDGIDSIHFDDRADLAQTIFGYINEKKKEALKGRVQFSHFKAIENAEPLQQRTEILGTPRASYYPIYVRQYNTNFKTFMDGSFDIAGWKRYPIHRGNTTTQTEDTGNENVGTTFTPLSDGVVFQGKLRYHNLKKAELGAILSALTFHNTSNTYHTIGMAKPLGYGKIEVKLKGIDDITSYIKEFELYITEQILDWQDSVQLKELLSMATEQNNSGNSKLKYMKLEEFSNNKSKTKDYLRCYTELNGINTININTLISQEEKKELEIKNREFLKKQEEYKEVRKKQKEHDDEYRVVLRTDNIALIESFISKYDGYSEYIEKAKKLIDDINDKAQKTKAQKVQKEADDKWEKIHHPSNKNYLKDALNRFIEDYPNSSKISEAKKELVDMNASKPKATNQKLDFSQVDDGKSIERVITSVQNPSDEDKDLLEEVIKKVYPNLNAKKKKQFIRSSKLMTKWLGQDRFEKIINGT